MDDSALIPFYAHEAEVSRLERANKRLFVLLLVLILALIGTNAGWIYYESQFEDQTITQSVTQDSGDGGTNTYDGMIIGGDYNGAADDQNDGENPPAEDAQRNGPM